MRDSPPIAAMPVAGLIEAIAADAPAPGSGAAAAVALALGVACARKALTISAGHRRDDATTATAAALDAIGAAMLAAGQDDVAAFPALLAALALPHDTARAVTVADAAGELIAIGERLAGLARDAAAAIDGVAARIDAIMTNDIVAARTLIAAGDAIVAANLAENRRHR